MSGKKILAFWKIFFQLENLFIHCWRGKNRTAQACAALILAIYHETKLTVADAMEYLELMRPCFEFLTDSRFGNTVAPIGGAATVGVKAAASAAGGARSMWY